MIPNNYQQLDAYALEVLEDVDFTKSPQLNIVWQKFKDGFAEQLAEAAINLDWEEWADDGPDEVIP